MKGKLRYLTISFILLLVLYPFLEGGISGLIILITLISAICFFGVYAVSYNRKNLIIALTFGLPYVVLNWIGLLRLIPSIPELILVFFINIFTMLFYAFTAIVILSFVLKAAKVNEDVLFGAVSIYMLIGGAWSAIYTTIELLKPGSFIIDAVNNIDGILNWSDFIYFSFETLTTLGYGDIIPVTSVARSFAVTEAIIGVMYLAIIISRLVGMYISQSKEQ
ncbi:MAG: two pore domain potassium channel family protein [Candidatus Aminicenantes bacterium]|nr:two pore domain potassium channel family protein [Candidatus Aminicenantes bacterium]NIM82005.1 two pore domain potassium channel family protein [Candidatus Aminicenantes bacterium]NIN21393.1 two pore domain potassium channel family protein [Candidatus Aminicenantes bacterium]NIN45214.1 two pore domain potassium channel family protein [Candidatus Aminicenantes bacterium]NIN88031.1 two pore domain potassium channel family protein [Candidatus Aminicenantes bacterium]